MPDEMLLQSIIKTSRIRESPLFVTVKIDIAVAQHIPVVVTHSERSARPTECEKVRVLCLHFVEQVVLLDGVEFYDIHIKSNQL